MLPFFEVDVFAARPFMGNPLAVVLHADGLSDELMQRIARWLNLSESVFVQGTDTGVPTLRAFGPTREIGFAGHALIGAGRVLAARDLVSPVNGRFRVKCGCETVPMTVDDESVTARIGRPERRDIRLAIGDVAHALDLDEKLVIEPRVYDSGATWLVVKVDSTEALASAEPAMAALEGMSDRAGLTGISAYAVAGDDEVHTRSFAPATGIPEDPVCGSGNLCVAAHAADTGAAGRLGGAWTARQGAAVDRDGRIDIVVDDQVVTFGGPSVIRLKGKITPGSV